MSGWNDTVESENYTPAAVARVLEKLGPFYCGTTGGSSTAYTLTPSPVFASLVDGMGVIFFAHTACGATPTLSVSGLTARSIVTNGGTGIKANTIPSGAIVHVRYDLANTRWVLMDISKSKVTDYTPTITAIAPLTFTGSPTNNGSRYLITPEKIEIWTDIQFTVNVAGVIVRVSTPFTVLSANTVITASAFRPAVGNVGGYGFCGGSNIDISFYDNAPFTAGATCAARAYVSVPLA